MPRKSRGAPVTRWTPEYIKEIIQKMDAYTEENTVPILAEFCYLNRINKTSIYEYDELAEGLKRLIAKKEAQLEKGALGNKVNTSMAIFSLKQLGWSDRVEVESTDLSPGMTHAQKQKRISEILANRQK